MQLGYWKPGRVTSLGWIEARVIASYEALPFPRHIRAEDDGNEDAAQGAPMPRRNPPELSCSIFFEPAAVGQPRPLNGCDN